MFGFEMLELVEKKRCISIVSQNKDGVYFLIVQILFFSMIFWLIAKKNELEKRCCEWLSVNSTEMVSFIPKLG